MRTHLRAKGLVGSRGEFFKNIFLFPICIILKVTILHGWASAELPRNRVDVNLFLRHIQDPSG